MKPKSLASVVGIASVAVATMLPATASAALSVKRLSVRDTGSSIRYGVTVCESAPADIHFEFRFFKIDGSSSGRFTDASDDHQSKGCYRYTGAFKDRYATGLWKMNLTITDSRGALRRASARVFVR